MNQSPKKRSEPAKKIGGGSLPLATATSPAAAVSSATPSNGGHPRNASGKKRQTAMTIQEWPIVKIDEISERIAIGPFGSRMKADTYTDSGVRVIRGTNISSGRVFSGDWVFISENFADELKGCNAFENDLVFPHRGAIGEVGIVPQDGRRYIISSSLMLLRCNKQLANSLYLYYFFKSEKGKHELLKNASQVGTPGIGQPLASLRSIEIPLPPINTQKKISQILSSLDDKIEANRRINQTLEAMAQALFQSWFVDFDPVKAKQKILEAGGTAREAELAAMQIISGKNPHQLKTFQQTQPQQYAELEHTAKLFPNRLVESELGLVPEGWKVKALDEIANYQNGLPLQKFRPEKDSEFLPVVKIAQLQTGIADTEERASVNIRPECIIDNGDVVFSWSGSLLVDIWCGGKAALNQHLFKVTSDVYPKWFYFYFTKIHLEEFQRIASAKAVTMGHIKREHLSQALCAVPSNQVIDNLTPRIESLLKKQIDQRLETKSLEVARDSLLPKLLSGEIDVSSISFRGEQ